MYQSYRGPEIAPAPVPARDDAKLFKHCVIVVLLCVMAAVMILVGMPARNATVPGQKETASASSGWSQVLVKLESMVFPAEKS